MFCRVKQYVLIGCCVDHGEHFHSVIYIIYCYDPVPVAVVVGLFPVFIKRAEHDSIKHVVPVDQRVIIVKVGVIPVIKKYRSRHGIVPIRVCIQVYRIGIALHDRIIYICVFKLYPCHIPFYFWSRRFDNPMSRPVYRRTLNGLMINKKRINRYVYSYQKYTDKNKHYISVYRSVKCVNEFSDTRIFFCFCKMFPVHRTRHGTSSCPQLLSFFPSEILAVSYDLLSETARRSATKQISAPYRIFIPAEADQLLFLRFITSTAPAPPNRTATAPG